jgi:two-component system LytT family response regulator
MIINAIIVDDDLKSRELIYNFCKTYSNDKIHILDLCNSVDTAIISIEKNNPNLVFLDIDMPEKNGFELVNHFLHRSFEIVFVTGHKNHQTEAIACSAMNYLMKPINPLSLKSIIDQFEFKVIQKTSLNRLEILKNNLNHEQKQIVFSDNDGFKVALVSDIIYCETGNGDGKCTIVTTKEIIVNSKSLKEMIQLLPETHFLKVSASAIVNKNFAKSFNTKNFELEMTNGKNIKISDGLFNKSTLMDALKQ